MMLRSTASSVPASCYLGSLRMSAFEWSSPLTALGEEKKEKRKGRGGGRGGESLFRPERAGSP